MNFVQDLPIVSTARSPASSSGANSVYGLPGLPLLRPVATPLSSPPRSGAHSSHGSGAASFTSIGHPGGGGSSGSPEGGAANSYWHGIPGVRSLGYTGVSRAASCSTDATSPLPPGAALVPVAMTGDAAATRLPFAFTKFSAAVGRVHLPPVTGATGAAGSESRSSPVSGGDHASPVLTSSPVPRPGPTTTASSPAQSHRGSNGAGTEDLSPDYRDGATAAPSPVPLVSPFSHVASPSASATTTRAPVAIRADDMLVRLLCGDVFALDTCLLHPTLFD